MAEKYIYFPKKYFSETSPKPVIVYKTVRGTDTPVAMQCSHEERHADNGLGGHYETDRLQPYSDELWERCEQWYTRRKMIIAQLNKEYKAMADGQLTMFGGVTQP